ncbi:hypothetical protein IS312_001707, partial [Campylobacter coli]|nr:hypothetical protein [Campylobacter coli]EGT0725904.1 hypothetical protein [Campylobacter coli]EHC5608572.1 hypothetical protein [Campylobacter coli]EHM3234012.1 hypothetical protein [Campylobacter coli]EHR2176926.1 hypothetical protein [Campylobacter coli]
ATNIGIINNERDKILDNPQTAQIAIVNTIKRVVIGKNTILSSPTKFAKLPHMKSKLEKINFTNSQISFLKMQIKAIIAIKIA